MMKRIAILVVLALVATGAFAQIEMSAGGGAFFDYSGRNGVKNDDFDYYAGQRIMGFGGFIFFDATYAELDVSFGYGKSTQVVKMGSSDGTSDAGSGLQLGFTLLGKYPIELGSITVFPLLGVGYNRIVSAKDPNGDKIDDAGDSSQFIILAGVGLDYGLTDSLYLRAEGLFQVRLPSKTQKDMADLMNAKTTLGMGAVVKVAVGYKF